MLIRCAYLNISSSLLQIAFIFILVLTFYIPARAQENPSTHPSQFFPPDYYRLNTEIEKIHFLEKAIKDSLNNGQLERVYEWSKTGLYLANKNNVDTMEGIFNFFIGKAFAYEYLKPDSAIFYYKKVLPFFPDKKKYYNVISVREIMERYAELGNKDSSFRYLDSLNALIDTLPIYAPRRVSLSQNIATTYQYFGMFNTAIHYFQISVNGHRKNGNILGLGLALANLAELYSESSDNTKALKYSKEALGYLEGDNMPYIMTAINIATYFTDFEQFDSAILYLQKAKKIASNIQDNNNLLLIRQAYAGIYAGQKNWSLARALLEKCIVDLTKNGDRWNLTKAYISLAIIDTAEHNYEAAKINLLEGFHISSVVKQQVLTVKILQILADISYKLKDYKSASEYQREFLDQNDSLISQKTKASLADLEVGYQTLEKEKTIESLKSENNIRRLELINRDQKFYFYLAGFIALLLISAIVIYQRSHRNKMKTAKMKAELQTQVLRSQMNPHFIFNCLNSIENFIMLNDQVQASDYLNKFSILMRSILDSTRNELVPIAKDMESLRLYVELEQLRFNNKFNYKEFTDPALVGGGYRVPSLLIQPFVENAIIHGLANSEDEDLNLTVTVSLVSENIKFIIQDNGVGRIKSEAYNMFNKPHHESIGLKITTDRINLYSGGDYNGGPVKITDLYDQSNKPSGTKVEITIKAI